MSGQQVPLPISAEDEREINSGLPADCELDIESWGVGVKIDGRGCGYSYFSCDTSTYLERKDVVAMLRAIDRAEDIRHGR